MEPPPQHPSDAEAQFKIMEGLDDEINRFHNRWRSVASLFQPPQSIHLIDQTLTRPQKLKKPLLPIDPTQTRTAWALTWQIHAPSTRPRWEPPILDYSDYVTEKTPMYNLLQQRMSRTDSIEETVDFEDAVIESDLMHRYFAWVHDQKLGSAETGNKEKEQFYEQLEGEMQPDFVESELRCAREWLKRMTRNLAHPGPSWVVTALKTPSRLQEPARKALEKDYRRVTKIMARYSILMGETLIAGVDNEYSPRHLKIKVPKSISVETGTKAALVLKNQQRLLKGSIPTGQIRIAALKHLEIEKLKSVSDETGTTAALVLKNQQRLLKGIYAQIQLLRVMEWKLLGELYRVLSFPLVGKDGTEIWHSLRPSIISLAEVKTLISKFQKLKKEPQEIAAMIKKEQEEIQEMAGMIKKEQEELQEMAGKMKKEQEKVVRLQRFIDAFVSVEQNHRKEWNDAVSKFEDATWMDAHEHADDEGTSIASSTEYQTADENSPDQPPSPPAASKSSHDDLPQDINDNGLGLKLQSILSAFV